MLRSRHGLIFVIFTIGYFLSYFLRSANAVIARDLAAEFGLNAADLGLMTSMFFVGFGAIQLPMGAALDRFGARAVTAMLMSIAGIGAAIFAAAPSFMLLASGRTLIGIGVACALMGTLQTYARWFPPQRYATLAGLTTGIGSMGGLLASTPLAWANAQYGWRLVFVVASAAAFLSAMLIGVFARNAPAGQSWRSAVGEQLPGGFGSIFRNLRFWRLAPLNFFQAGGMLAVQSLWGGPFVMDVLRLDRIEAGNLLVWLAGGVVVGYLSCGWLADRFGVEQVQLASALGFALSQVPLLLAAAQPNVALVAVAFALFGYTGSFNLLLLTQVRGLFPAHLSGRASTACNVFGFLGTFGLQWGLGLIISRYPQTAVGGYAPEAYTAGFGVLLVCTLLATAWYTPMAMKEGRSSA